MGLFSKRSQGVGGVPRTMINRCGALTQDGTSRGCQRPVNEFTANCGAPGGGHRPVPRDWTAIRAYEGLGAAPPKSGPTTEFPDLEGLTVDDEKYSPLDPPPLGSSSFRKVGEEQRFSGKVFSVSTVHMVDPDGEEFSRDVVHHPGAVSVIAVRDDGSVSLLRQLRVPVGDTVLEAPAGTCDHEGEPSEETARRELEEEVGLRPRELHCLGEFFNSPGYTSQRTVVYLATGLEPCETRPDGVEERWSTAETVRLDDVEQMIADGKLHDMTTISGLLLARSFMSRNSTPEALKDAAKRAAAEARSRSEAAYLSVNGIGGSA